ncbi:MAG: GNAT family N-acetyltransferase [Rhodospirillaceae bacterium]
MLRTPRLSRSPDLIVSSFDEADAEVWGALMRRGFGLGEIRIAHFRAGVGDRWIRIARREGRFAGTGTLIPMTQWFGGRPVPVAGIAAVAVMPDERCRGVASTILQALMVEARGLGLAMVVLHAGTLPLYRRAGFARAGVCVDYRLSMAKTLAPLADPARRVPLRMAPAVGGGSADVRVLNALRSRLAHRTNGLVERPPLLWANLLTPAGIEPPTLHLILGEDGAAAGYLLLHPALREEGTLHIVDACLPTADTVAQALSFLAGESGKAAMVTWPGGPDDALAHLAPETEVDIDDWDTWLARVLDAPAALMARGYPRGLTARLELALEDALFPANHGYWRLEVADGVGRITAGAAAAPGVPVLTLRAEALAPLLTGHLGPVALQAMDVLDGSEGALALAALLFAGPSPWMADRF